MKPQSPMRLVTNAFLPADALASSENQNAMRKYEQAPTPSQPRNVTSRLLPSTSITRKPNSGNAGISQTSSTTSCSLALQHRDVVGGGAGPASHEGDDDAEPDYDLGGRHDEHEEDDRLSADVVERLGERDERQV